MIYSNNPLADFDRWEREQEEEEEERKGAADAT